ncbi:MAG: flagellar export protein FliJ [Proteobacteria bacterium]|jgi:predicted  nucleic acid-binding Zn-ribbon protein|nr:MAG: flagellar export protein FliJ [Pseudomonadota bacterium]
MKSRETSLRLKRFLAEEKRRKVADIEHMIREFEHMAQELDRQIQAEEERTGIRDKSHFAYSTFAKAAAQRRDNLRASIANLHTKLEEAVRERDEACAELERLVPDAQLETGPFPRHLGRRVEQPATLRR